IGRVVGGEVGTERLCAGPLFLSKKIYCATRFFGIASIGKGDRIPVLRQGFRELEAEPLRPACDECDVGGIPRVAHGAAASGLGGMAVAASSMSWFVSAIATTSRPKATTCRSTQRAAATRCREAGVLPVCAVTPRRPVAKADSGAKVQRAEVLSL